MGLYLGAVKVCAYWWPPCRHFADSCGTGILPDDPTGVFGIGNKSHRYTSCRIFGGITEEILLRFALTLLVWILYRISKSLKVPVYWIAILITSFLFAAAHLPMAYQAVENSYIRLILYILKGNMLGGIISDGYTGRKDWRQLLSPISGSRSYINSEFDPVKEKSINHYQLIFILVPPICSLRTFKMIRLWFSTVL